MGLNYRLHQTTYTKSVKVGENNAVYFDFSLAGVTVNIVQANESFLQFLIGLCTSSGGIFAVGGVLGLLKCVEIC